MHDILERVRKGRLSVARAAKLLRVDAVEKVSRQLRIDLGRPLRTGIPEVVLAEGKAPSDVRDAARAFVEQHGRAIVSRISPSFHFPRMPGVRVERYPDARLVVLRRRGVTPRLTGGRVAVVTAGASDRFVAAEAELMAREMGCTVHVERDVGVASLYRLVDAVADLEAWRPHVYVAVAGREGALAPVLAGLASAPVIGVPVSTGYGHRGRGEAALSTMLQSCSPLVTVNIDAGLVAGAVAAQIANRMVGERDVLRKGRA